MYRNQDGSSWRAKAGALAAASAAGASLAGLLLGALGSMLPSQARIACASALGVAAVLIAAVGRGRGVLHCDRETPQRWVHLGPLRWATRNGFVLGIGATTRISFWLWYAVPFAALLFGDALLGALVYGTYGGIRGLAPYWVMWRVVRRPGWDYAAFLLGHNRVARVVTTAHLLVVGVVVSLVVGA